MHQLSVFHILHTIVNKLDVMIARIFWRNHFQQGIHWEKIDVLHQPQGQGTLGIRNISIFNKVFL